MAMTQTAWVAETVNGRLVLSCNVTHEAADLDNYTLKTPANTIDPNRSWTVFVNVLGVTLDGSAIAVDIWGGYADDFALASDNPPTVTSGGEVVAAAIDDVKSTMISVTVDPNYTGTAVPSTLAGVRGIVNAGVFPYYVINCDGTSTLAETDKVCHYVIVQ